MRAVVALLDAEKLGATRLASDLVILTRQSQRDLDAIRSAGCEERSAEPVGGEELAQHVAEFDHCIIRGASECGIIGQLPKLRRNRLFHRLARIAEVHVPKAANRINRLVAIDIDDAHALTARDDLGWIC